jgi:pyruvate dehydrogenase E2 component (dihydrolipoamide acetyltransferase)
MAEIVTMPKLGFDMAEGTLIRWVVAVGEQVKKGAILAEIETDKATVEVESAFEGLLAQHLVPEGEVVPVNTPIAVISAPGEKVDVGEMVKKAKEPAASEAETPQQAAEKAVTIPAPAVLEVDSTLPGGVRASPLARRMAEELGVPLKAVHGSGEGGRITKKDVEAYLATPLPKKVTPAPSAVPLAAKPTPAGQQLPLNRLRAIIGKRMVEAKQRVPHFYITHEYDLAALLALRQQVNQALPEEEKTSVNDFVVKAAALALREFPNLNASLDEANNQIIQHEQVNIGIAVAVEGGLLTVVCHDADRKSVRQIGAEVRPMVQRARDGKVRPDDIEGSTFSVSNMGMYDVEHFIAIINPPEAAILAVGSAREVPVVKDGQIVSGTRMKATLSVDHRVSDGAEGARFMQALAKYLEEPIRLLL